MKLFSKLLLTLVFITGSAQAVLDLSNLPAEVPTELQDKLLWGLWRYDEKAVAEALDAGANPYDIEFTRSWFNCGNNTAEIRNYKTNAYEISYLGNRADFCDMYDDKYDICSKAISNGTMDIDNMVYVAQSIRKPFGMAELLITRGISVDTEIDITYLCKGPLRIHIRDMVSYFSKDDGRDEEYDNRSYVKEFRAYMLMHFKYLELLIEKHQPEAKI